MPSRFEIRPTIYKVVEGGSILASYAQSVSAGFPKPSDDYVQEEIDLKTFLMPHPYASFVMKIDGDSMENAHLPHDSHIVVDRSIRPCNNRIVVAVVNGDITVKRFVQNASGIKLVPANDKYCPISINEEMEFSIWGTVSKVIIDLLQK